MGTRPGHPRVPGPVPRLVALLLGVAGAVAAEPRQVSSVLGESVVFSLDLSDNGIVKKLEWTFRGDTGATILVAEVTPGGSLRPDPRDRFGDRLEVNETALRIKVLERGDCGIYQARIQLHPAVVVDRSFNLSLYEPLPEPEIRIQRRALTSQECNLTVRCQAPAGSGAEVTWQPQGHLCGDSQTLCLSLPATASSSSYTCVAGNDIQRRTAAIHTGILCRPQGDRDRLRVVFCLGLVALGVGAAGIAWIWRKKRRKKAAGSGHGSARDGPDGAALAPRPSQDPSPEVQYAEIQRRIPLQPQERVRFGTNSAPLGSKSQLLEVPPCPPCPLIQGCRPFPIPISLQFRPPAVFLGWEGPFPGPPRLSPRAGGSEKGGDTTSFVSPSRRTTPQPSTACCRREPGGSRTPGRSGHRGVGDTGVTPGMSPRVRQSRFL